MKRSEINEIIHYGFYCPECQMFSESDDDYDFTDDDETACEMCGETIPLEDEEE